MSNNCSRCTEQIKLSLIWSPCVLAFIIGFALFINKCAGQYKDLCQEAIKANNPVAILRLCN